MEFFKCGANDYSSDLAQKVQCSSFSSLEIDYYSSAMVSPRLRAVADGDCVEDALVEAVKKAVARR